MQTNKKQKLLALRFSAIGDVAMTIPVLYAMAEAHPDVEITFVSQKFLQKLFIDPPGNLHFYPIDLKGKEKNLPGIFGLFRRLRKMDFDAVLDLHDVLRSKTLRALFSLSGTPTFTIDKGRKEKKELTRRNDKRLKPLRSSIERYCDVFVRAGYNFDLTFKSLFHNEAPDYSPLYAIFGEKNGVWIGLAPFAKHMGKIYPEEQCRQLIAEIASIEGVRLFLFGGGKEELSKLETWSQGFEQVVVAGGKIDLPQELTLMSLLDVMISMDSANMHFASLVGTPVVSVWGATHPFAGFMGYGQSPDSAVQIDLACRPCSIFGNKPCFRGDFACMKEITPQQIKNAVLHQLSVAHERH